MNKCLLSVVCMLGMAPWAPAALIPKETKEFDGTLAPAFELQKPEGGKISSKDFAGKPYVLLFFASWCPPCRSELSQFIKIQEKYGKDGLRLLGTAIEPIKTP